MATASGLQGAAAVEPFDYPNGSSVAGQAGGSGWIGSWTTTGGNGTLVVEDGSLSYPGILASGGKMRFTGVPLSGTTTTIFRTNAVPLTSGIFYARFLAQNLNGGRRYFGLALFDGNTERLLLGQGSTFTNWTLNHVGGITNEFYTNILVSPVPSVDRSLLVLKMELLPGPERVTFWVNPDLSQPENLASAVGGTNYLTDADFVKITRLRIGGGGYSATAGGDPTDHYLDEISVSTITPFTVPSPKLSFTVAAGSLTLSWPDENLGWILQAQTDAGISANWTKTDVPGSEFVTSTNLPLNANQPANYFRLRSP